MANNTVQPLILSAATASINGQDLDNFGRIGMVLTVDVTAVSGTTPTLVVKVQGKDRISGKYYDITGAATASISTVSTTQLTIYPGLTAVANSVVSNVIPLDWRVVATIGGTTPSFTGTVAATLIGT